MDASNQFQDYFDFRAPLTFFQGSRNLLSVDMSLWESELVPFACDYSKFDDWIRARWRVTSSKYSDWRDASKPVYDFAVDCDFSHGVQLKDRAIEGLLLEVKRSLNLDGSVLFALDFMRAFNESFELAEFVFVSAGYSSTFLRYFPEGDETAFLSEMRDRMDSGWKSRRQRP